MPRMGLCNFSVGIRVFCSIHKSWSNNRVGQLPALYDDEQQKFSFLISNLQRLCTNFCATKILANLHVENRNLPEILAFFRLSTLF